MTCLLFLGHLNNSGPLCHLGSHGPFWTKLVSTDSDMPTVHAGEQDILKEESVHQGQEDFAFATDKKYQK